MNEKRIREITLELEGLARVAQSIQNKYVAHMGLHSAALIDRDKERTVEHRKSLHLLLDRMLDNGEAVQRLTDELVEVSRVV